jgi:hypothetical protein
MSQLVACPDCSKNLQVPDDLMGKKVQCPECKSTFTAETPDEDESRTATTATPAKPTPSKNVPAKAAAWDKNSHHDDDEDDDRDSRPKKRKKYDDDDDDDDDRRDSRRRRRRMANSRGHYTAHRGGMILAFGLISLIGGIVIFGIIAWIMGNSDLAEMRAGRMDPDGEGMTQAGRIMGMISVIIWVVAILTFFGIFGCIFMVAMTGAAGNRGGGPPNRRR